MTKKTLFITGASSGIGAATARAAAKAGWNIGLFARSKDRITALAEEIGPQAMALPGDATSRQDQIDAMAKLAEAYGGIDAAFANAGVGIDKPTTAKGDPEEWDRLIAPNINAVLYTAHHAMPYLKERRGHFLVTGSLAGRTHVKGSIYSASKWFVHGYAGNLALEMAEWGGRCTLIAPGMVDTEFFSNPAEGRLQAEDISDAVLHALSSAPRNNIREIYLTPLDTSGHH